MSRIKVLSSDLIELAVIDDVLSASRTEIINSDNTLSFSVLLTKQNTALFNATNVMELETDYFDIIKYKKGQSEDGRLTCDVDCEHVSYRLNNSEYDKEYFTGTGTPTAVLSEILSGTGFSVDTVEFTDSVTYSVQEKKSRRGLLVQFAECLGGELLFSGFTASIIKQRGNTEARDLIAEGCISVISKTLDKTKLDDAGNPTISYECTAFNPAPLALGDTVLLDYETLDIGISLRIVSLTTNPYNKYQVSFSVSNMVPTVEDAAYEIATATVSKDSVYNGCRIGPEYGFEAVRSDKMARGIFNSDTFALQAGDGSGSNWKDKVYFDPVTGNYIFDGTLSAAAIEAIKANINVVVTNTTITNVLYSTDGNIARLTVDKLLTGNVLNGDDLICYIDIQGQYERFIEAHKRADLPMVQYTNYIGEPLYWIDDKKENVSTDETDYPVMVYQYDTFVKMSIQFEQEGDFFVPKIVMGAGSGSIANPDYGKGFIFKDEQGLLLRYVTSTGKTREIRLGEDGITGFGKQATKIQLYSDGMIITYPDGSPQDWNFTLDGNGYINQLINNSTGVATNVSVVETPKP